MLFLFLFDGLTREKEPKYGNDLGREKKRWFVERRARSGGRVRGLRVRLGLTGRSISSLSSPAHAHSTEPERPRRERELTLNREQGDRARERVPWIHVAPSLRLHPPSLDTVSARESQIESLDPTRSATALSTSSYSPRLFPRDPRRPKSERRKGRVSY